MKQRIYKIWQRKPDVSQDESSYSTSIEIEGEVYPVVGHGFTQGNADTEAIKELLMKNKLLADKQIKTRIDFMSFLAEKHTEENPELLDDNIPDAFNDWMEGLDVQDVIDYTDKYVNKLLNKNEKNN